MKGSITITIRVDADDYGSIESLRNTLAAVGVLHRMSFNGRDYRFVIEEKGDSAEAFKALTEGLMWGVNSPTAAEFTGDPTPIKKPEVPVH